MIFILRQTRCEEGGKRNDSPAHPKSEIEKIKIL